MCRFILFAGPGYYPGTLLSDAVAAGDDLDRLRELGAWMLANPWIADDAAEKVPPELRHRLDAVGEWDLQAEWWAVVDREALRVVSRGGGEPYGGWGPWSLDEALSRRGPYGGEEE